MIRLIAIAIFISTASREHVTVAQSNEPASTDSSDQPTPTTKDQPTLGGSTINSIQGRIIPSDTMIIESQTTPPGNDSNLPIIVVQTLAFGGVLGVIITVAIGSAIIGCYCICKKR